MDGGAANYYKSVRVCATCHRVYSTLDAARELLQYQQEETAALGRSSHTKTPWWKQRANRGRWTLTTP